jgi:hypothetical protein
MVLDDLMMTWHFWMEEDPCTLKIWPLEAQRLPQIAQRLAHCAKTSPLGGMTSSLGLVSFVNLNFNL